MSRAREAVEAKNRQGARNGLTDIVENLPQGPKASDEAGALKHLRTFPQVKNGFQTLWY